VRGAAVAFVGKTNRSPKWIKPQPTRPIDEALARNDWLHEIKYDGYRMHAQLDRGKIQLLTRTVPHNRATELPSPLPKDLSETAYTEQRTHDRASHQENGCLCLPAAVGR